MIERKYVYFQSLFRIRLVNRVILSNKQFTRKLPRTFRSHLIYTKSRARVTAHNPLYNCLDTKSCARKTPFPYVPRSLCLFFHVRASRPLNWIYLGRRLTVHTIVYLSSKIRGNTDPPSGEGGTIEPTPRFVSICMFVFATWHDGRNEARLMGLVKCLRTDFGVDFFCLEHSLMGNKLLLGEQTCLFCSLIS